MVGRRRLYRVESKPGICFFVSTRFNSEARKVLEVEGTGAKAVRLVGVVEFFGRSDKSSTEMTELMAGRRSRAMLVRGAEQRNFTNEDEKLNLYHNLAGIVSD